MKNYKVKALINFNDIEENEKRIANESVFMITEERYRFLRKHNAVSLVEIVKEEPKEEVKVDKPKKTRKSTKCKESVK